MLAMCNLHLQWIRYVIYSSILPSCLLLPTAAQPAVEPSRQRCVHALCWFVLCNTGHAMYAMYPLLLQAPQLLLVLQHLPQPLCAAHHTRCWHLLLLLAVLRQQPLHLLLLTRLLVLLLLLGFKQSIYKSIQHF